MQIQEGHRETAGCTGPRSALEGLCVITESWDSQEAEGGVEGRGGRTRALIYWLLLNSNFSPPINASVLRGGVPCP